MDANATADEKARTNERVGEESRAENSKSFQPTRSKVGRDAASPSSSSPLPPPPLLNC